MSISCPDYKKYGKLRGLLLLLSLLPDVAPISKYTIIRSIEDWEAIKYDWQGFSLQRIDGPLDAEKPTSAKYGTSGRPEDIPRLLEMAKKDCPEYVLLLMKTKEESVYRYDNDGGFNVLFDFNRRNGVVIELVGRGFDGHELTSGVAVHERYVIPWEGLSSLKETMERNPRDVKEMAKLLSGYNTYTVSPEEYAKQREERFRYLTAGCGYDPEIVEGKLPTTYQLLDRKLVYDLIEKVVLELYRKSIRLFHEGLLYFGVQGNFANGKVQPWEVFIPERWA
ncbi:hypothetical protein IKF04_02000 [Candidatus Saccharibacteria bacterium]|nr:hypothetical protein [Candidatus Saccharibacteria bacterium]